MKKNVTMELQVAIMSTGLVQPVDVNGRGSRIEVLCRLVPGQEKSWLQVMDQLLEAADQFGSMDLHICRRYVRRQGQMVFGYHLGIETKTAKLLVAAIDVLIDVLKKAKPDLVPTVSAPSVVVAPPQAPAQAPRTTARVATLRMVERRIDDDGNEVIVEEMPLPHARSGDMNKPTHKGGRGATRTAASAR